MKKHNKLFAVALLCGIAIALVFASCAPIEGTVAEVKAKAEAEGGTKYTVSFDINGATGGTGPVPQAINAGSSIILPSGSGLTKTPLLFGGWNTESDGTGITYNGNSSYTPTGSIMLYARWGVPRTVTFNINEGAGTTPDSQIVAEGSSVTLPGGSEFSKSGYAFKGWNTSADGLGTDHSAGSSYQVNGDVTLYANWDATGAATFTVKYETYGGTSFPNKIVNLNDKAPKPVNPSRTGYIFDDWYDDDTFSFTYNFNNSITKNTTIYAKWNAITYTVTYDKNASDATGSTPDSGPHTYDVNATLTTNGYSRTGYTFSGWALSSGGAVLSSPYKNLTETNGAKVTLYAKWTPLSYTVTFNKNNTTTGSTDANPTTKTVTYPATNVGTLPTTEPTRTGYRFTGWNTSTTGSGTDFTATTTVNASITVYAQWVARYTVTYNLNGGTGYTTPNITSETVDAGASVTLPYGYSLNLSKPNYVFCGWNTSATPASGSGRTNNYNPGASYTPTASITLYARWELPDQTLSDTSTTLKTKMDWLQSNAFSEVTYTVNVYTNETLASYFWLSMASSSATVKLVGSGGRKTISYTYVGQSMITMSGNWTLILGNNITLQGLPNNNAAVVYVGGSNNTLIMESGSEITGNISSSYGGAVYVYGGTFEMKGGNIYGNQASQGGGVYLENYCTFKMSGGNIYSNTAKGSAAKGGGVFMGSGTIKKTGGTIYGYTESADDNKAVNTSGTPLTNAGHAVYCASPVRRKEGNALLARNLDSEIAGATGGWDN